MPVGQNNHKLVVNTPDLPELGYYFEYKTVDQIKCYIYDWNNLPKGVSFDIVYNESVHENIKKIEKLFFLTQRSQ